MGRANGHSGAIVCSGRRADASTTGDGTTKATVAFDARAGAAASTAPAGLPAPHRVTPQGRAVVSMQGQQMFLADSADLAVPYLEAGRLGSRMLHVLPAGASTPIYPVWPRPGRAAFDGELVQRALRHGQVFKVDTWCDVLFRARVGTKTLGGKGVDKPIGESLFREQFHAIADAYGIPLSTMLDLQDEGRQGAGVCRNRQQVRDYTARLYSRVREQAQSLVALQRKAPAWFAASEAERRTWAVYRNSSDAQEAARRPPTRYEPTRVQRALDALDGHAWVKNASLAAAVYGPELDAELSSAERVTALKAKAPEVRELLAALRASGVPVEASSATGYRLCEHTGELTGYIAGEKERMESTVEHAQAVALAGARWYPDTAEEEAAAAKWRSQMHEPVLSERVARREQGRKQAQQEDAEEVRRVAGARAADIRGSAAWAEVVRKRRVGEALSRAERELTDELKAARGSEESGKWPVRRGGRQFAWDPRPAAPQRATKRAAIEYEPAWLR